MFFIRTIRQLRTSGPLEARKRDYALLASNGEWRFPGVEGHQLALFNPLWRQYVQRIPYYRDLVASGQAPARFETWAQFIQTVPVLDKAKVRTLAAQLTDPSRPGDFTRVTGGSTGQPTRMPEWREAFQQTMLDKWLGRSWHGIRPDDRLFMIWGHSHTLDKTAAGRARAIERRLRDLVLGTHRLSAYDLSAEAVRKGLRQLIANRPAYVVGYSGALEFFARNVMNQRDQLAKLGLKACIATGEEFPTGEGPHMVQRAFGCPVVMEYGSVETDVIAYTAPVPPDAEPLSRGFQIFWRSYFVEAGPPLDGRRRLMVTSLFPRAFPLVRYDISDEAELFEGDESFPLVRFKALAGRANSVLEFPDGSRVHTMGIKHCVEGRSEVLRFQIVQSGSSIELRMILAENVTPDQREVVEQQVRAKLVTVHPQLKSVQIDFNKALEITPAGKVPMLFKKPSAPGA
jgi:phenylacetate-CoA ligase